MGICCIAQGTQTVALWQPRGGEGLGGGRKFQEGGDICTFMADTYWCIAETNTIM